MMIGQIMNSFYNIPAINSTNLSLLDSLIQGDDHDQRLLVLTRYLPMDYNDVIVIYRDIIQYYNKMDKRIVLIIADFS